MRSPWLLVPVALVVLFPSTSASAPADPAARGLDAFIHAGNTAPAGSPLVLDLETFGFGTVIEATPLAGATIDLAWDPEHLGRGVSAAPPALSVTSDGKYHLDNGLGGVFDGQLDHSHMKALKGAFTKADLRLPVGTAPWPEFPDSQVEALTEHYASAEWLESR